MKVLLISPRTPDTFWSFKHVLRFVSKKSTFPPLGLLTVAAMLPREWSLKVVDLNVNRLLEADLRTADVVMISAMLVHEASVREVIARCAVMGKQVIAGGPLFTTGHESFPEIQHFVLGEAEELMPQLVADLQAGRVKKIYQTPTRPSMALSPGPRWDLIDLKHYGITAIACLSSAASRFERISARLVEAEEKASGILATAGWHNTVRPDNSP